MQDFRHSALASLLHRSVAMFIFIFLTICDQIHTEASWGWSQHRDAKSCSSFNGHLRVATKASQHPLACPTLKYPTSEIKSRCLQRGTQNVFDSINYIFNLFSKSFIWVLLRFKVKSLPKTKLEALRKSRAGLYIKKNIALFLTSLK